MNTADDFHHQAMDFAGYALMERMRGNAERATELFKKDR